MKNITRIALLAASAGMLAGCASAEGAGKRARWWKGVTHIHSMWSDGSSPPEMVAKWYKEHDYNFAVVADHGTVQKGTKWKRIRRIDDSAQIKEYRAAFGDDWVSTRKTKGADGEVLCRQLDEYRGKVEEAKKFIVMRGDEITCKNGKRQVHVVALNVADHIPGKVGKAVSETFEASIRNTAAQATEKGRPMAAILCHPGWGNGPTAEEAWESREVTHFEVVNGGPAFDWNTGNANVLNMERWWDVVLTKRMSAGIETPLFGVAADDMHHIGRDAGQGWIMVKAEKLTPAMIISAINRGDFYSSTGVILDDMSVTAEAIGVKVQPEKDVSYTIQFIGTLKDFDGTTEPLKNKAGKLLPMPERYSRNIGTVLKEVKGTEATYKRSGKEMYVRVKVSSSKMSREARGKKVAQAAFAQPVL